MKIDKTLTRRFSLLIVVMALWAAVIGARLYFLHVVQSADLKQRAERQQQRVLDVSPRRGVIYDRNGNELAVSIRVDSVFAVPDEIENPLATAKKLSSLTGIKRDELLEKFESGRSFAWIKRKLDRKEAEAIRVADIPGIYFQKEDHRFYPKARLASHVLGYVNMDEEGMGGLEYRYNDQVRGEAGKVVVMTDARGRSFQSVQQAPGPGANLITTIDENIQYIVEKEVQDLAQKTQAAGISIVAMDPRSGEILGMANHPQFNPNEYGKYSPNAWSNRSVSLNYEPGSTFKIVTAAAALEEKLTNPLEQIDCQMGSIVLFGHRIRDHKPFGLLTVKEVMQYSSDVGIIKLGLRLGDERFAGYIDRLGFGRATGIDLPGEERGLTKPASRWSRVSVGAISMGQEIGTTPLQILSMVSVVANGGILYRPYVVKRVEHPQDGVLTRIEPHGERVISENTALQLQDMLEVVVTEGTAQSSRLEGYRAAGKTGTAQKIDETGRYSKTKYVASFAGYAPASNPQVSLIVVIDEPAGLHGGGQVAAPAFKRVTEQILRYMSVPSDVPLYAPEYADKVLPSLPSPPPVPSIESLPAAPAPVEPESLLMPASLSTLLPVSSVEPIGAAGLPEIGTVTVPDFTGKSLRQVTEESMRLGLKIRSSGSGAATRQSPGAGAHVRPGARIQVQFSARSTARMAANDK